MVTHGRPGYKISVFLSYPNPTSRAQQSFISQLCSYLDDRGFAPRTLGVTDYDTDSPLKAVRRIMRESSGLITVALRRTFVDRALVNHGTDLEGSTSLVVNDLWLTSPWAHIEPAMAFQLGLPILLFRETGVAADGVLERGVVGTYMPEFDSIRPAETYLGTPEWQQLMLRWELQVRTVVERKGEPPKLY